MVIAAENVVVLCADFGDCNDGLGPSALTISTLGLDVTVAMAVAVAVIETSTVLVDGKAVVTMVVISSTVEIETDTTVVTSGV